MSKPISITRQSPYSTFRYRSTLFSIRFGGTAFGMLFLFPLNKSPCHNVLRVTNSISLELKLLTISSTSLNSRFSKSCNCKCSMKRWCPIWKVPPIACQKNVNTVLWIISGIPIQEPYSTQTPILTQRSIVFLRPLTHATWKTNKTSLKWMHNYPSLLTCARRWKHIQQPCLCIGTRRFADTFTVYATREWKSGNKQNSAMEWHALII